MNFAFKKGEKLCSRKAFENLLKDGSSYFCFPLKIIWIQTDYPLPFPAQTAFAVPKRKFKRANKRNLIKRRLREGYRLNKEPFYQFLNEKNIKLQLLFVYVAPDVLSYHEIEPKIKKALENIEAAIKKNT